MIQQRGKRWRVVVQSTPDPLTGKRHQLSGSAPTEREAVKLERQLRLQAESGVRENITFRKLVEEWWASPPRLAATTAANYRSNLDKHVLPVLGDKRVTAWYRCSGIMGVAAPSRPCCSKAARIPGMSRTLGTVR